MNRLKTTTCASKLATLALGLGSTACGVMSSERLPSTPAQAATAQRLPLAAEKLWDDYVKKSERLQLQSNCRPKRFGLPPGVKYRGVAILFHGYTACPQQYFEWAPELAKQGFEVLLPLNPGHGRSQVEGKDVIADLPKIDGNGWKKYAELGKEFAAVAQAATGERIVGGISVGGAIAAAAHAHIPSAFDRVILLSPLFEIDGFFIRLFMKALGLVREIKLIELATTDALVSQRIGWGEGCERERNVRPLGRAGICDFLVSNLAAVEHFGNQALATLAPSRAHFQIVGVESDKVASNGAIKEAVAKLKAGSGSSGQVSACFFPQGVNHSLLSRFDTPQENKFWLSALFKQATGFVTQGKPFAEAGQSLETPYPACKL